MKLKLIVTFIACLSGAQSQSLNENQTTLIDLVIEEFQNKDWTNLNETCRQKTLELFNGAKNFTMWAAWVWDSLQISPQGYYYDAPYQLSNYDQCLHTPWRESHPELEMQYCTVTVHLNKDGTTDDHTMSLEPYGSATAYFTRRHLLKNIYERFYWTLCVHPSCGLAEIEKITETFISRSHLALRTQDSKVVGLDCQKKTDNILTNNDVQQFCLLLFLLCAIVIGATILYKRAPINDTSLMKDIVKTMSITENWKELTNTKPGDFDVLNGMKSISSIIIVAFHIGFVQLNIGISNSLESIENVTTFPNVALLSLSMVVDTFYSISGFLLAKQMLGRKIPENPFKTILKRYLRLAPLMMLLLLYHLKVLPYLSGPKATVIHRTHNTCASSWWKEATLLPNLFGIRKYCVLHVWSNHTDFQLTCIAIFLFTIYRRNKKLGIFSFFSFFVYGLVETSYHVITKNIQILMFQRPEILVEEYFDSGTFYLYFSTVGRITPYMVGVAAAFFVHYYKPRDYKNYLSKKVSTAIVAICTILLMIQLFIVPVLGLQAYATPNETINLVVLTTHRMLWAASIMVLFLVCLYGDVPGVTKFLGSSFFNVYVRLTFGVFCIHIPLMIRNFSANRGSLLDDPIIRIMHVISYSVVSSLLAIIGFLLVEAPAKNIGNYLLRERKSQHDESQTTKTPSSDAEEKLKTK